MGVCSASVPSAAKSLKRFKCESRRVYRVKAGGGYQHCNDATGGVMKESDTGIVAG